MVGNAWLISLPSLRYGQFIALWFVHESLERTHCLIVPFRHHFHLLPFSSNAISPLPLSFKQIMRMCFYKIPMTIILICAIEALMRTHSNLPHSGKVFGFRRHLRKHDLALRDHDLLLKLRVKLMFWRIDNCYVSNTKQTMLKIIGLCAFITFVAEQTKLGKMLGGRYLRILKQVTLCTSKGKFISEQFQELGKYT